MSDQPPARLEQPLLEAREGPGLDGDGQNKPAEQIAEVVGDDPEQQADLIGPESVTGQARPRGGIFALLDPRDSRSYRYRGSCAGSVIVSPCA